MGLGTQLACFAVFLVGRSNAQNGEPIMSCSFDDGLCDGWVHEEGELYRWEVRNDQATKVGPARDYNSEGGDGGYLYFNDDGSKYGKAIIRTPRMDLSKLDRHCLRFVYFAGGYSPGEIRMIHSNKKEGRTVSLFFKAGPKSKNETHWIFEDISVPKFYSNKKFDKVFFRIQAQKSLRGVNSIAIDDVTVTPGPCPKFRYSKAATTAPPELVTLLHGQGGLQGGQQQGELTNEKVKKRNEETIRANEERNRKVQEMNALINSGQYTTTRDPNQPTQPTQPTQPMQPHEMEYGTETASEEQRQQKIQEEQRKLQEEAEKKRKEEQERIAREERERKELVEKKRKEQEEKQRKQKEEQERRNRELQEKQKQERLRKQKEEEDRRKLQQTKKREEQERRDKEKAENERKMREEQERKQREEEDKKRKAEEERLRKIEEERRKQKKRNENQQDNNQQRRRGKGGKKGTKGGKRRGGKMSRKNNPNYEKCGKGYAHKTKQLCCKGLPKKKSKQSMLCCGRLVYDSNLRGCCGGEVFNARGTSQCCGTQLYDVSTHACCAETPYELATNACVDGEVQPIAT